MKRIFSKIIYPMGLVFLFSACTQESEPKFEAISQTFGTKINPSSLLSYANQNVPSYILKDNTRTNPISDEKATLGRVLFYDKNLSIDNTIACASCHKQAFAFGDTAVASKGVQGGLTLRHSMRLVNARFSEEAKFFWDERAASLEIQTTTPIQDHAEMGFSGQNGRPNLSALLTKLSTLDYYQELFELAYGSPEVTEQRIQESLANFIRSMQSFDSKYDIGRAQVPNDGAPFPNFTAQENLGKQLFLSPPTFDLTSNRIAGGLGCQGCHRAPEFDIDPNSRNNGIIRRLSNTGGADLGVTRAPSLRDMVNPAGELNGPLMHTGGFNTLQNAIGHYNTIDVVAGNTNLDPRLSPRGSGQNLNITPTEREALVAFLKTLTGREIYTHEKWSNPF